MSPQHQLLEGLPAMRPLVRESWQRSLKALATADGRASSDRLAPPVVWESRELVEFRRDHPLAAIMPVITKLLVEPSHDTGLLVAVGDEHGRLLWVEGDSAARRHGEGINFARGADWSETAVGTSAPGTALVLGKSVQIMGEEHFNPAVHSWSCTAVPLHDPDSGSILGIVDITGGPEAVGANTLSLVQASVAAAEAQLRIERLELRVQRSLAGGGNRTRRSSVPAGTATPNKPLYRDSLQILGRDQGLLHVAGEAVTLSERHTEIMAMLALHPDGLTAEELTDKVYPEGTSLTSIRAEMVRLRKLLQSAAPTLVPQSRPYRLPRTLVVDAEQVRNYLDRGAHRLALNIYRGEVMPRSLAPAIETIRNRVAVQLREAILNDASPDVLLSYLRLPEAADDVEAWRTALRLLPPRSPRRSAVVAHVEALEA
ncbi:transcriptional regulator of acetoin/glycerol metabolism [Arthrobacter stackebrandtii]|uniref:Transcriptional regulator of acetoin/glycerol metabolism n=1 Tax=Arthrobacter stackebrandtii TaxID=272161 RepID=A0ABS4YRU0_9MICC|nr:transcriptional regulator [Arthrobacter stackebrandtii]MBP2411464.1 transcriptional regulator of acetoin/glycerol metabolism [Arthrobacter stackebrandtii]PYH00257.1 transcriptional regulator [Arthrobacter stackebrandtii]